jgi:FAD:protein FMN transferase
MLTVEKQLNNEIMSTETYIALSSAKYSTEQLTADIENVLKQLQEFQKKYSRFEAKSEITKYNTDPEYKPDGEFDAILEKAAYYNKLTGGIFDIHVLTALKNEGYVTSFIGDGGTKPSYNKNAQQKVRNWGTQIDFGGIGKGYICDKIAKQLSAKYQDFCISLGGDMRLNGVDQKQKYPYWAIEIENPFDQSDKTAVSFDIPILLVTNKAIATSGVNKRKWQHNGQEKNHLIDPRTKKSVNNSIVCVTVIADSVLDADILAKTVLILGVEDGRRFCENKGVNAVIITKDKQIYFTKGVENYVWQK